MKDRLEEFVRGHRQDFNMFEPGEALWGNIEKKLDRSKKLNLRFYLSRAATVAAIFALSFMVQQFLQNRKNKAIEIPELKEAEMYYSGLIDAKLQEIKPLLVEYPDVEQEMKTDLSELDSVYNGLKNDLKDNVANHEVIEAMIENYRMRINMLEEMLQYLEKNDDETKNDKTPNYEL